MVVLQILVDLLQMLFPIAVVIEKPTPANISMLLFMALMFWLLYFYGYRRFYLQGIRPLLLILNDLKQVAVRPAELSQREHLLRLRNAFRSYPMLLPLWTEWESAFYRDAAADQGVTYSSAEAEYVFSEQRMLAALGFNLQFYQALPGYFTGLGLLGTFWGLTLGLSQINLSTPELEVLKEGIRRLLDGMGTDFGCSLWGVILSLSWSWYEKRKRAQVREKLAELQDLLNQLVTRRTPESWLTEILSECRVQSRTLTAINNTMAETMATALEKRMTPVFLQLASAIDGLRQAGTSQIAHAIGEGAGQQLKSLGDMLVQVQRTMETTVGRSADVQEQMRETMAVQTQSMAETFRQVLDAAAVRQQEMNRQTDCMIQSATTRQAEMNEQTGQRLQDLLAVIAASLRQQQAEVAGTIERAGTLQEQMNQQAGANVASMVQATHQVLDLAAARQQAMAEQTQAKMQQLLELMAASLLQQQGRLENTTEKVTADFAARMGQMSQQMDKSLQETTRQAGDSFRDQMSEMSREMKGSLQAFEISVIDNASRMQQETRAVAETLHQAFENVANRYEKERDQVTVLLGQVQETMEAFRQSAEQTGRTAKQFEQAAHPLYDSARQLQTALEQMQQYQDEFRRYIHDSEQRLRDNLGVSQASVETIQESLRQTQISWQAYESKFGVLRTDLEQIFDSISKGLREYRAITDESLSQFLQLTQNSLGQCVGQLSAVINELSETVEDLYPILENRPK